MKQAALFQERLVEFLARGAVERGRELQALDRDRLVEAEVVAAVHDAESALAHDGFDAELAVDRRAHPAEEICRCHARVRARLRDPRTTGGGETGARARVLVGARRSIAETLDAGPTHRILARS